MGKSLSTANKILWDFLSGLLFQGKQNSEGMWHAPRFQVSILKVAFIFHCNMISIDIFLAISFLSAQFTMEKI